MKLSYMIIVPILALASCTTYVGQASTTFLGDETLVSGGKYSSGGGITVAAELREVNGQTMVCGAWAQSIEQSILTKGAARGVLASSSIYHGRERVAQDLTFMKEVIPAGDYTASEARCRLTERPWQPGQTSKDFSIRMPRKLVYRDFDDLGGGVFVYFTQSGPEAGGY